MNRRSFFKSLLSAIAVATCPFEVAKSIPVKAGHAETGYVWCPYIPILVPHEHPQFLPKWGYTKRIDLSLTRIEKVL